MRVDFREGEKNKSKRETCFELTAHSLSSPLHFSPNPFRINRAFVPIPPQRLHSNRSYHPTEAAKPFHQDRVGTSTFSTEGGLVLFRLYPEAVSVS